MRKIFSALIISLFGASTLMTSCSDVPAPYEVPSPEEQETVGDGSKENPYNVATSFLKQDGSTAWVQGYIVGVMETDVDPFSPSFTAPFKTNSNIMIADSKDEEDKKNCLIVQLPAGSIRSALNLKDHEENEGKPVTLQGKLTTYFGTNGLKEVAAGILDGKEIGDEEIPNDKDNPFGLDASKPVDSFKADFSEQPDYTDNGKPSNQNYEYQLEGWKNIAHVGDREWSGVVSKTNEKYIKASAQMGKEEVYEMWFISPAFKVDAVENKKVSFDCAGAYFNEGNSLKVFFLELKDGKMVQDEIKAEGIPTSGDNYKWAKGITVDIAKYNGKVGFIGFQYISHSENSTTYQLDNIQTGVSEGGGEVVPPTPSKEVNVTKDAPYEETFAENQGNFTIDNKELGGLEKVWVYDSYKYMKATGFDKKAHATESWLVSPIMNIASAKNVVLTFEQAVNFAKGTAAQALTLLAKEESATNWENITITYPEKDSWNFVKSGDIDLSKYAGKKVQLAFKYTSTEKIASTWEIKNLKVAVDVQEGGEVVPPTPSKTVNVTKDAPYEETFAEGQGNFTIDNKELGGLEKVWVYDSYKYMKATGFDKKAHATESWLVSPIMNIASAKNVVLTFEQAVNFAKGTAAQALTLLAKEEGATNWENVALTYPEKDSWDFIKSGNIDLSKYAGKKVQIAFKYTSTTEVASTWEIKNLKVTVEEGGGEVTPPAPGDGKYASNIDLNGGEIVAKAYIEKVIIESQEYDVVKLGSSSKAGTWISPALKAGATELGFYGVAWKGAATKLTVSVENGGSFENGETSQVVDLAANDGASGNAPYTITPAEGDFKSFKLKDVTASTTIKFTTEGQKKTRAIVFDINVK